MNFNKIIILGRVGRDPELKAIPSGSQVCTFSLATSRVWKDKDGEQQEQTEWHNVVFWNKPAEIIARYVKKGALLLVEGRVQTRTYEKDGVKMYRTEIMGEQFQLPPKALGGGSDGEDNRSQADKDFANFGKEDEGDAPATATGGKGKKKKVEGGDGDINPDDIPF